MNYDSIIIVFGLNGFSAAITLVQSNLKVLIVEEKETIGGILRFGRINFTGIYT